ncbi:MAG: J domain-containing protein [Pseudobdellovibrionaceae bacterium]|nr:J domain-containing protein [Pseudobdellovibrionaceae bacterium]
MPKIFLKPNSPDFAESVDDSRPRIRMCDMPDCIECGEYKAPKDRGLSGYYWFCLPHVQEYNKAWDFFSGMSPSDIEHHINTSTVWDRPTRRFDGMAGAAETLKRKAWQTYNFTEEEPPKAQEYSYAGKSRNTPEMEALAIMGLEPPVTLEAIKERYKALVKKHHPDHIGQNKESEDLLKKINMAFTVLKLAYQKFEDLPERT